MPEEIMVASWRVMTVSSWALTFLRPRESSMLEPGLLLVQVHDGQAARLQLGGDRVAGDARDLALLGRAGRVDGLEGVGGGRHQAATSDSDSMSLRISAGSEARLSAAAMVILPSRTRPASEASIVCMPCWPPVWISE